MKENSIKELEQRLEELYRIQQARLDVGADDLDIREEIAEVEEEIKELKEEVDEDRALREIKRELADKDRREYMSRWFAKDLEILVYYIEKLQLENKKLKNQKATQRKINELLVQRYSNSIPIQKVKDNIEKLNDESHAEELEDIMNRKNYTITELVQYVLQELLEKE